MAIFYEVQRPNKLTISTEGAYLPRSVIVLIDCVDVHDVHDDVHDDVEDEVEDEVGT